MDFLSHLRLPLQCDIVMRNNLSQDQSMIVYIYNLLWFIIFLLPYTHALLIHID